MNKTDCTACFENGPAWKHGHGCRLYLAQRAEAGRLRRLLAREPDRVSVPEAPDYSTPEAVTARCHEAGLWSSFAGKPVKFKPDSDKAEIYRLLAKPTGLYAAFSRAVVNGALGAVQEG